MVFEQVVGGKERKRSRSLFGVLVGRLVCLALFKLRFIMQRTSTTRLPTALRELIEKEDGEHLCRLCIIPRIYTF
jgi:hypothetical protein